MSLFCLTFVCLLKNYRIIDTIFYFFRLYLHLIFIYESWAFGFKEKLSVLLRHTLPFIERLYTTCFVYQITNTLFYWQLHLHFIKMLLSLVVEPSPSSLRQGAWLRLLDWSQALWILLYQTHYRLPYTIFLCIFSS